MATSMPHFESMFQSVQGSQRIGKIDLCHAYWQLALAVESQGIFLIQTPAGVYKPTRLIQGSTDAGNYFQEEHNRFSSNKRRSDLVLYNG
jgi:hypothetical protein